MMAVAMFRCIGDPPHTQARLPPLRPPPLVDGYSRARLDDNQSPNAVLTEREVATHNKGLPVYRMLFRRV